MASPAASSAATNVSVAAGVETVHANNGQTNFLVAGSQASVKSYGRRGVGLTIQFDDGRNLLIEGFFAPGAKHSLVFVYNNSRWVADFDRALGGDDGIVDASVTYKEIGDDSTTVLLGILGAAAAGGGIAAVAGGGGGGGDKSAPAPAAAPDPGVPPTPVPTAPTPPVLTAVTNNPDDFTTTLSGTAEPFSIVKIYDNGELIGSVKAGPDGLWAFTPTTPLPEGTHKFEVTATRDTGGGESTPTEVPTLTVDRTPPDQPSAPAGFVDNAGDLQSNASTATSTDDTTPGIQVGVGLTDTPKLYVDGVEVPATYDPVAGTLTPVTPLEEGAHQISFTLTDAAGNESERSDALTLTVDNTAPTATVAVSAISTDTGDAGDFVTSDPTLVIRATVTGTVEPGETVQIDLGDGTGWHAASDIGGGVWELDATGTTLADGTYTVRTRVIDAAGNGGAAASQSVVITSAGPSATIAIASISEDTGVTDDFVTSDRSPTIHGEVTGALASGETAQISFDGGSNWVDLSVGQDGTWSYAESRTLIDGDYTYLVRIINSGGKESAIVSQTITVDGTAPGAITIELGPDFADSAPPSAALSPAEQAALGLDRYTNDAAFTLQPTLPAEVVSAVYEYSFNGGPWTVLGAGAGPGLALSVNLGAAGLNLGDGTYAFRVTGRDLAGNSTVSNTTTMDFDASLPAAPVIHVAGSNHVAGVAEAGSWIAID